MKNHREIMKRNLVILIFILTITLIAGCESGHADEGPGNGINRQIILNGDSTDSERNRLLKEDIEFFKRELPNKHKNPFSVITKEEFEERVSTLEQNVDKMDNYQVFSELGKIIASIKDAHTMTNYVDGKKYPLDFYVINDDMYIVNTTKSLKDMMYSKVISVDGISWDIIKNELKQQIAYENESWLKLLLGNYFIPSYIYGAGIEKNADSHTFMVERDGETEEFEVPVLNFEDTIDFYDNKSSDKMFGRFERYYDYKYLQEDKAIYFEYNVCADMDALKFKDFNDSMFKDIEANEIEKIIVDLRGNTGGNSEILNPFTERLKSYIESNSDVEVYVLVGRKTMSSGMFAIFRIRDAVPDAVCVGEPTGGAIDCYGDVKVFYLPNSQLPVQYSTKYFEFSKTFKYEINGNNTYTPDVLLSPSIEDFMNGNDVVLNYVLQ